MAESIEVLVRKDGSAEFDCVGCGVHVWRAVGWTDPRPLCALCIHLPGWTQTEDGKLVPPPSPKRDTDGA